MQTTITTATPTKLRNGDWGARVNSDQIREGDTVEITTRAGKTWTAAIVKVLWSGDGKAICATQRTSSYVHSAPSCGFPCPVTGRKCTRNDPCHDCQ